MRKTMLALALFLAAAGCTNKEKQAEACAGVFLDSFLSNDYDAAAECCADGFKEEFLKTTAGFKDLDSNVRALLISECSKFKAEIVSAQKKDDSDTVVVDYRILRQKDSVTFEKGAIGGTLIVVDGKINRLGK